MGLAKFDLHITNHAYLQYRDRVGEVEYGALLHGCSEQLRSQNYNRRRDFLQLDGVWWVFTVHQEKIIFVTCYGRSHMDLPTALKWARANQDRINLKQVD